MQAALTGAACAAVISVAQAAPAIDIIPIPAGEFTYQAAGEFLDQGRPVDAPRVQGSVAGGWVIMRRQVSQAEYARCVQAGACKRLDKGFRELSAPDLPAVGISWSDATTYAAWLSRETGQTWRLPNYTEWVRAAAEQYREEGALPSDPANPSVRWLAEYEREITRRRGRVKSAQSFGHFGVNALGVSDMGGNVWEWTDTCFASHSVGTLPLAPRENCGVRILAGAHIAAMPDFIRDPRNGACSIGLPPANLGFRLVRSS
ncbi:formylglycine-generating enzyme family protein [Castellaniella sp.]|uniref:formylglycine-generating enzyme family protein n=1 Tax=Castellaniella sp. TaxID=1955812 RepID=UPI002AFE850A|nr:SUMF1/EgtB/PvdO family nonheme iron enzyme [Castellaniella sp.]